jgi:hypothetical protein
MAAFREWLLAVVCDVCSLPDVDPVVVSAGTCCKNGDSVLFGGFRSDRGELLSFYPRSVPEAAAFGKSLARVCGEDLPRLYVWSPAVPGVYGFGVFERARLARDLHGVVDFWATTITKNTPA